MKENPEFTLAFDFVHATHRNIFLTGKAGTGKTTFLHKLREAAVKRMIVVAPTGVAAINAGGVTIHSFFQMPFGPILPGRLSHNQPHDNEKNFIHRFNKRKINLIKTTDLLVIDEVSMVRADLLDGIDEVLRRYRNKRLPFGGMQVLMIGDLQQLPPVVKPDEWNLLKHHYDTPFFFSSRAFQQANAVLVELMHVYRQQDTAFIAILNEIRNNSLSPASIHALNDRYVPGFTPANDEGYITLTTHNATANRINEQHLGRLPDKPSRYTAAVEGVFPPYSFPTDEMLFLKEGAQVMFVKNDPSYEKRYYNGKIGKVVELDEDTITVVCEQEEDPIFVERVLWENVKFTINDETKAVEEEVTGTFYQFPLRLAWAITIHKSQGLTFEKAIIDSRDAFAHGQTYVALSRCKSLEGLVLSSRIDDGAVIQDGTVSAFNRNLENRKPGPEELHASRQAYVMELMEELFNFRQLQYQVEKLQHLAVENNSVILGNLPENTRLIMEKGTRVLDEVGKRFVSQLKSLVFQEHDPESSPEFRDRILKAGQYFLDKTKTDILNPLELCRWDSDNKLITKEIKERMVRVKELVVVKIACFKTLGTDFSVRRLLHARAVASLEEIKLKSHDEKGSFVVESRNSELFNRLKEWRSSVAREAGIAHYRVASQKLLVALSNQIPVTASQLKAVKGMGPKKMAAYGEALLQLLRDFCAEGDTLEEKEARDELKNKKKPAKHTREITLELYRDGKSVEAIAATRNLTRETIENHLGYYIATGALDVDAFVSVEQVKTITNFLEENPEATLSRAKESLGGAVTWSDLKFVRHYVNYLRLESTKN